MATKAPKKRRDTTSNVATLDSRKPVFNEKKLYEALELLSSAYEATTKDQALKLARKALSISPYCSDALIFITDITACTPKEALPEYLKALEVAKVALEKRGGFDAYQGHFWLDMDTRPYMRARLEVCQTLWSVGQFEEAIEHAQAMLKLNYTDNQGVRYWLVEWFLKLERISDLKALFAEYPEECSPQFTYTNALLAFRESENDKDSLAKEAMRWNQHIPKMLSGKEPLVETNGYVTFGGEDEASDYVEVFSYAWKSTSGAIDWLLGIEDEVSGVVSG